MDELSDPAVESAAQADDRSEQTIGRRRLLKMLGAAGGAAVAALALPEVWSQPGIVAQELPKPNGPTPNPTISNLHVDAVRRAQFNYQDPLGGTELDLTLMGVGIDNGGQLDFGCLRDYQAVRKGNAQNGVIRFPVPWSFTQNGAHELWVQLRVFVPTVNCWDLQNATDYRDSNIAYCRWTTPPTE